MPKKKPYPKPAERLIRSWPPGTSPVDGDTIADPMFEITLTLRNGDWFDMDDEEDTFITLSDGTLDEGFKNNHFARDCPRGADIRRFDDEHGRWIHGCVEKTAEPKDLDEYKRTLWQSARSGGSARVPFYTPRTPAQVEEDTELLRMGYFIARTSEDGEAFVLVNLAAMKNIEVQKGWVFP